jgi:hypothetical protein
MSDDTTNRLDQTGGRRIDIGGLIFGCLPHDFNRHFPDGWRVRPCPEVSAAVTPTLSPSYQPVARLHGAPSISMALCSTSWCKRAGMPRQPSASSSIC